jgi:hypothetical protein
MSKSASCKKKREETGRPKKGSAILHQGTGKATDQACIILSVSGRSVASAKEIQEAGVKLGLEAILPQGSGQRYTSIT